MTRVFVGRAPEMRPTESAAWNVSKWNQARWTEDDNLCEPIEAELDKRKRERGKRKYSNRKDALIAETAIKNGYTLVTCDVNLREIASGLGANCMTFEQLLQHCRK